MITVTKSFQVTNILLIASALLTMMQSFRVKCKSSLSLQISTAVCVIAAYHYSLMIQSPDNQTVFRYLDWFVTTPLLLWELCIILDLDLPKVLPIAISLNMLMLSVGFAGELFNLNQIVIAIVGSLPLIALYLFMVFKTPSPRKRRLLHPFFSIWALYGIVHMIQYESLRAVSFNILDVISKAAFGLYIFTISECYTFSSH